jgi:undecaprenyl-diphosphatase
MNPLFALLLGIIEGLTEYLPVSSTGHLILTDRLLGVQSGAFEIVIQLGAVLAVVVHYRETLVRHLAGLVQGQRASLLLAASLATAFAPTAVVGLLFRKAIKARLFAPSPVAAALIVGGLVMIVVERVRRGRPGLARADAGLAAGLEAITPRRALVIGLGQTLSLWPGTSRSMCTIVAGQLTGLDTRTAAEFSFLLALPTLGAATVYEALKDRAELAAAGGSAIAIGFVVSFFTAWAVVAAFLRYLTHRGLEPFGYYRIVLGVIVFFAMR